MFGRLNAADRRRGWAIVMARRSMAEAIGSTAPPLVEEVVDGPGGAGVDARRPHQVLEGGPLDRLHGAEVVQEGPLAARADARDLVERALGHVALAAGPVRTDGEAMRLVAQPLPEIERRGPRRPLDRRLAGPGERFPTRNPAGPLGRAAPR